VPALTEAYIIPHAKYLKDALTIIYNLYPRVRYKQPGSTIAIRMAALAHTDTDTFTDTDTGTKVPECQNGYS